MKTFKLLAFALVLGLSALAPAEATVLVEQVLVNTEREVITVYDDESNVIGLIDSYHWQAEIYILDDAEGYIWLIWETPGGYVQEIWAIGPDRSYITKVTPGFTSPSSASIAILQYLWLLPPSP